MNTLIISAAGRLLLAGDHPEAQTLSLNLEPIGSILVLAAITLVLFVLLSSQAGRADLHEAVASDDPAHH
jgi:hypothetical protein